MQGDDNKLHCLWGEARDNKLKKTHCDEFWKGWMETVLLFLFSNSVQLFLSYNLQAVYFTQSSDRFHHHGAHEPHWFYEMLFK